MQATPLPVPWLDRAGRLSPLKLAVFLAVVMPGLYLAYAYAADTLGPKPITALLHETGQMTVRCLLASLAITPLRRIANLPNLIQLRRMLGLSALAYAAIHLVLYAVDQNFILTKVVSEIVLRFYLTIGFVALLGLVALGITSTDGAIRRMGKRWHHLHRLTYTIAVLGLFHYFLQSKIDVSDPVFWTGLFLLLIGWRAMHRLGLRTAPLQLLALALAAALLTAGLEALWYNLKNGIPPDAVLSANLDFSGVVRPAWWVLGVGLVLPVVSLLRPAPTPRASAAKPVPAPARQPDLSCAD